MSPIASADPWGGTRDYIRVMLRDIVTELHPNETPEHTYFLLEFLLHGLSEHSLISRNRLTAGAQFKDLLSSMFTMPSFGEDEDDEDEEEKPRRRR